MKEEEMNVENENGETALSVVGQEDSVDGGTDGTEDVKNEEVRKEILRLRTKMDQDYWELGIALEHAYREDLYRSWGFESWKQYVEEEVDVGLRTVQYLVKLQTWFEQVTPAIQEWIRGLGWTKARMLMHVVTQENAAEWKARVSGKTVAQIEAMIETDKKGSTDEGGGSEPGNDDDAENELVKLKAISMFRPQRDLVDMAMEKAGEVLESDKPGHILSMICQQWLAMNVDVLTKGDFLKEVERYIGWKLVALGLDDSTEKHEIMWGEENLDILRAEDGDLDPEDEEENGDNVGQNPDDDESGEE